MISTLGIRRARGFALPLRLAELAGDRENPLDLTGKRIYRSAMNHVDPHSPTLSLQEPPAEPGATLFSFLDVADRLFERISEVLARVGLSYAKYEVLQHLRDAEGPVSLGALAEGQRCARSNITQLVDRLESEGMVRRVDDPEDRRGVRAELTSAGLDLVAEGETQMDLVRAQFAASFTAREKAELGRLLAKIR
ncbi:MAG: MarR family winged helix-turn-helix transcriptional regulator [Longimicrobiales bacterium]